MDETVEYHVVLAVITNDKEKLDKLLESMSAMARGHAMDGHGVNLSVHTYPVEEHS